MEFVGMPKPDESVGMYCLQKLRRIAKLAEGQKWYQRALRHSLRREFHPSTVWTFGFTKGKSTTDTTTIIRQICWVVFTYIGFNVLLASMDVRTFDCLDHDIILL